MRADGTLWAWGYNDGALDPSSAAGQILTTPVQEPGSNWVAAAAGYTEDFAIASDGTLWAWGGGPPTISTNAAQYPSDAVFDTALGIPALNTLINLFYFNCYTDFGNCPGVYEATTNYVTVPVEVGADSDWATIASAFQYPILAPYPTTMALKDDGSLWLWGRSPLAGVTNSTVYLTPSNFRYPGIPCFTYPPMVPVPQRVGTNTWSSFDLPDPGGVATSGAAVTTAGDLYLWGGNQDGQLLSPPPWLPLPVLSNLVCRLPSQE